jgi:MFS family permease
MDFTLACIFLIQFLANAIYSILAPFFPIIAKEKGLRGETIGLIFSGYPIAAFLSAPIYGLMIIRFGRRKMFLTGSLLIASTLFGFSSLPYLESSTFVAVGFFSRFLQGLGVSGIVSSSFAIIASNYKDNMETVLGMLNSIGAMGMMLGPLIGAGIYEATSFSTLYILYGTVFVIAMVFAFLVLPADREYSKTDVEVKLSDILGQKVRDM